MSRALSETEAGSVEKGERRIMKISKKDLSRKKAKAILILETQGLSYDEWLAQKYEELFDQSEETIRQALAYFKEKKNPK